MKSLVYLLGVVIVLGAAIVFFYPKQSNQKGNSVDNSPTPTPASLASSASTPTPASSAKTNPAEATSAVIKTSRGDITVELYPGVAPKSVENFATLSQKGYYNGISFHRVEDWVIQAGDPTGTGAGGESIWGGTFTDDFKVDSDVARAGYPVGTLAMAKKGTDPKFAGSSQFFIMKDAMPLPLEYAIFGKVTAGLEVVKNIKQGDKITGVDIK